MTAPLRNCKGCKTTLGHGHKPGCAYGKPYGMENHTIGAAQQAGDALPEQLRRDADWQEQPRSRFREAYIDTQGSPSTAILERQAAAEIERLTAAALAEQRKVIEAADILRRSVPQSYETHVYDHARETCQIGT